MEWVWSFMTLYPRSNARQVKERKLFLSLYRCVLTATQKAAAGPQPASVLADRSTPLLGSVSQSPVLHAKQSSVYPVIPPSLAVPDLFHCLQGRSSLCRVLQVPAHKRRVVLAWFSHPSCAFRVSCTRRRATRQ